MNKEKGKLTAWGIEPQRLGIFITILLRIYLR